MSIIVTTVVPEGIAMAADSRLTYNKPNERGGVDRFILTDNAQKLFLLNKTRVGISSCGDAIIDNKTIGDFLRLFEINELNENENVSIVAEKLCRYLKRYSCNIVFHVNGYIDDEPHIYTVTREQVYSRRENGRYFAIWNGELDAISRLLNSDPPTIFNFDLMPLKDAIDFTEFLVELTIKYQRFEDRIATVGGHIDSLIITKDNAKFIKHKIYNP